MSHTCSTGSTRGIHSDFFRLPSDRVPSQVQKLDGSQNDWGYSKAQNLPRGCLPLEESPFSVRIFKILQISECVTEGCFLISPKRPLHYCTCSHHIHHFTSTFLSCVVICSILPNHIWLYHTPVFAGQTGSQCHPGSVHVRSSCWGLDHGR